MAMLYSSLADPDWPDHLDPVTGQFVHYGDNKRPGAALARTPRHGNKLLERTFAAIHAEPARRETVPPYLVFTSAGRGRSVEFKGLAVPGYPGVLEASDLVAVWRTAQGSRFQNYRATFTDPGCGGATQNLA